MNYNTGGNGLKRYNNERNIIGPILHQTRKEKGLKKKDISARVGVLGITITEDEIYRIEANRMSVKDFEAVALCIAAEIDCKFLVDIIKNNPN